MTPQRIQVLLSAGVWVLCVLVGVSAVAQQDWTLLLWVLIAAFWVGIALMWCVTAGRWQSVAKKFEANTVDAESWWP